jgi:hypothetical protein
LDNRSILGLQMECWGLPTGFFCNPALVRNETVLAHAIVEACDCFF